MKINTGNQNLLKTTLFLLGIPLSISIASLVALPFIYWVMWSYFAFAMTGGAIQVLMGVLLALSVTGLFALPSALNSLLVVLTQLLKQTGLYDWFEQAVAEPFGLKAIGLYSLVAVLAIGATALFSFACFILAPSCIPFPDPMFIVPYISTIVTALLTYGFSANYIDLKIEKGTNDWTVFSGLSAFFKEMTNCVSPQQELISDEVVNLSSSHQTMYDADSALKPSDRNPILKEERTPGQSLPSVSKEIISNELTTTFSPK